MTTTERTVQVGDVWRDMDSRSPNDVVVLAIRGEGLFRVVQIQRPSRRVWVNARRFVRAFEFVCPAGPARPTGDTD